MSQNLSIKADVNFKLSNWAWLNIQINLGDFLWKHLKGDRWAQPSEVFPESSAAPMWIMKPMLQLEYYISLCWKPQPSSSLNKQICLFCWFRAGERLATWAAGSGAGRKLRVAPGRLPSHHMLLAAEIHVSLNVSFTVCLSVCCGQDTEVSKPFY